MDYTYSEEKLKWKEKGVNIMLHCKQASNYSILLVVSGFKSQR